MKCSPARPLAQGDLGKRVLLAPLPNQRLFLTLRLLLLESLAGALQIVVYHAHQARVLLLRVEPGAKDELRALPLLLLLLLLE